MHVHAAPSSARRLLATLALTALVMVAEAVGGLLSGSLALLADAGHMLTDVLALTVACAALVYGRRPPDPRRTWGFRRLEVLAALLNGLVLLGVAAGIGWTAVGRALSPAPVGVGTMVQVASIGLVANLVGLALLRGGAHNLNVRGALWHLAGDTLGSVGVLVAGAGIAATGWLWLDPLISALIAVVLAAGALRLLAEVTEVLLEAAPRGLDPGAVRAAIAAVEGVGGVHDLHVWSITHGVPALSAHVVRTELGGHDAPIRGAIEARLRADFGIGHTTLQLEPPGQDIRGCGCA